jgi:hypothetical protein
MINELLEKLVPRITRTSTLVNVQLKKIVYVEFE